MTVKLKSRKARLPFHAIVMRATCTLVSSPDVITSGDESTGAKYVTFDPRINKVRTSTIILMGTVTCLYCTALSTIK